MEDITHNPNNRDLEEMTALTPERHVLRHVYDIGRWRGLLDAYLMLDGLVDEEVLLDLAKVIDEQREDI
jgi:hypothetical protein